MQKRRKTKGGFVILFAVLVSAVLLTVGLAMQNLAMRESMISYFDRESMLAFYAAETGVECVRYWDIARKMIEEGSTIECVEEEVTIGEPADNVYRFQFNPLPYITDLVMELVFDGLGIHRRTLIDSQGINTADASHTRRTSQVFHYQADKIGNCPYDGSEVDGRYVVKFMGDDIEEPSGALWYNPPSSGHSPSFGPYTEMSPYDESNVGIPMEIPSGSYRLTLVSFDDHEAKVNQDQQHEQWYIRLYGEPSGGSSGDIETGLTAHWSFDNDTVSGDTVSDISGNGNDGQMSNVSLVSGKLGEAAEFNRGSQSNILVPDNSALDFGENQDFTIAVWVKSTYTPTANRWPAILSKESDPGGGRRGYNIGLFDADTDSRWFGEVYDGGSDSIVYGGSDDQDSITDGTWYHIVFQRDGNEIRAYRNGSLDGSAPAITTDLSNPGVDLRIGSHTSLNSCCRLSGTLDDMRIYDRALSEEDILALYALSNDPGEEDLVAESDLIRDIPSALNWIEEVVDDPVVLNDTVKSIKAWHGYYKTGVGGNSIYPVCAVLDPV